MKQIIGENNTRVWVKHGKGVQTWPDGGEYDGNWHEGKMQGFGKFVHANQDVYEGEFVADKANGKGKYT